VRGIRFKEGSKSALIVIPLKDFPVRNKHLGIGEPGYHPLKKLKVILAGLRYTVLTDFTVAYKLVLTIPVLAGCFFLRDSIDAILIIVATALVLTAEILNSAIEAICDFIEPKINPRIKIIKDVSAAAVGVAIAAWSIVMVLEAIQLVYAVRGK